jgi:hypothetical protein
MARQDAQGPSSHVLVRHSRIIPCGQPHEIYKLNGKPGFYVVLRDIMQMLNNQIHRASTRSAAKHVALIASKPKEKL